MLTDLLSSAPDTDAVFCINDDLALGALFEAQRMGLSVPDQLGIIGFNDLEFAAAAVPGLSSVYTPRAEMGRRAAELILARLRGESHETPVRLDCALRPRGSTARGKTK